MAQRTIVKTYDDIDGTEIGEGGKTVSFAIEGTSYEIDLSSRNVEAIRDAFRPYTSKARRLNARTRAARSEPASVDTKAVRAWAEQQGIQVSGRGRLSGELLEQYRSAH